MAAEDDGVDEDRLDEAGGLDEVDEPKAEVAADPVEMAAAGIEPVPVDPNPVLKPETMLSRLRTKVAISPNLPILLNPSAKTLQASSLFASTSRTFAVAASGCEFNARVS